MMRRNRLSLLQEGSSEETPINLTPLIDVVFVVLIMFILVAPMLELDRIQLASGAARDIKEMATVQENHPVAIHVHEDNTIWMHHQKVTEKQLIEILKQAKQAHPQKIPQLFHDKKAQFGTYQTVKNAVELSGFEQLDVILQPGG